MRIYYSGRVQGVGFRYAVKTLAPGYELSGTVRNLDDGRVELVAEGSREELDAFREGVKSAGVGQFIRNEEIVWEPPVGGLKGFEIIR